MSDDYTPPTTAEVPANYINGALDIAAGFADIVMRETAIEAIMKTRASTALQGVQEESKA